MSKIIAIANQKGGVGKTTTCVSIGAGLAREGFRVLCVDSDPQASLSIALGVPQPDTLNASITDIIRHIIDERQFQPHEGILQHPEGIDFLPASIDLSAMEMTLIGVMSRETILRQYLEAVKDSYDYILIDCMPSLGMLTVNALAAADSVLISFPMHLLYPLPMKANLHTQRSLLTNTVRMSLKRMRISAIYQASALRIPPLAMMSCPLK